MLEVTTNNFEETFQELKNKLDETRFICIDLEFSLLSSSNKQQNSIFDSGPDRYKKLRITAEQMIPFQVGVTLFTFNPSDNSYLGFPYTFYIFPASLELFDRRFLCQASSIHFLVQHSFDYNKLFYDGIPYMNTNQEIELLKNIRNNDVNLNSSMSGVFEDILEEQRKIVFEWFAKAKVGDTFILFNNLSKYKATILYMLHRGLRLRFNKCLWTETDHQSFVVKKIDPSTYKVLESNCNIHEKILSDMLGFTKVYRMLKLIKKPIVGHNLLFDLMVIVHNFENPLPKSYGSFKTLVNSIFPVIYDTKSLSFDLFFSLPENKRWERHSLEHIYYYFKDGPGRHLAINSPIIECSTSSQLQKFHSAGWDAFCTGYVFIRIAHRYAALNFTNVKGKKFVSSELLNAVKSFKNKVNIIRGDLPYICLDGKDPLSQRPPRLIIDSTSSEPVNIDQLTSILSSYGFIEVKPHSLKGRRVIVAVDNFSSAKCILRQLPSYPQYKIQQYNLFKHSPIVQNIFWCGIIVSGAALAWFGCLQLNKSRSL